MKKRILSIIVAAVLLFVFGGCEMVSFDVSELMSPPKATGEKNSKGDTYFTDVS